MNILITGVGGLVGSEAALYFGSKGHTIIGVDNNIRSYLFGPKASITGRIEELKERLGKQFIFYDYSILDEDIITGLFQIHYPDVIIHTAAQPSHDWAAKEPKLDFQINAVGTLNLLEATRQFTPHATFIFTSTNKVYGDTPNYLPLVEGTTRFELPHHKFTDGITEAMSIDRTMHSLFGVSKASADLMVQEYGRYFNMKTAVFRCGCITGPAHRGVELHGFLSYLMKCTVNSLPYTVFGYGGKQVRDNIHALDLVKAFERVMQSPGMGHVYNLGGGVENSCSVLEAISKCEALAGKRLNWTYDPNARKGDHMWWITSNTQFIWHYPTWEITKSLDVILEEIFNEVKCGR